MAEKSSWVRKPQEQNGKYQFNGKGVTTSGVVTTLSKEEIDWIVADLFKFIAEKGGLVDYLQAYDCSDGRRVWFMDALDKDMLEGDGYTPEQKAEYNVWTMLLPSEY